MYTDFSKYCISNEMELYCLCIRARLHNVSLTFYVYHNLNSNKGVLVIMYNASLIMYNITLNAQVSYINTSLHYVGYKIEY